MLSYPKILLKFRRIFSSQVSPERCHAVSYRFNEKGDALLLLKLKIWEQRVGGKKKTHKIEMRFFLGIIGVFFFFPPAFNTVC